MVDCLGVEINIIILFSCDSDLYQILKIYFSFELYLIDQSFDSVTFLLFSTKCGRDRLTDRQTVFYSAIYISYFSDVFFPVGLVSPKDTLLFCITLNYFPVFVR